METKLLDVRELKELLAVPGSGTREQIVYLDVDDLVPDPRNFYELSDIDALAENVALFGIQQPLRVRADPMDPDKYVIVSGHRRREALRKLIEEDGREDLRQTPCIVEAEAGSEALQELRLIYANSDTRRMTSAEISRQAVRVEALLYELKEQGYDFPGRMRDHVAEACKVSKSKLSRLKVIRDKLIRPLADHWENGRLNEEQAYILSQLPPEYQRDILENAEAPFAQWWGWRLTQWSHSIKAIRGLTCPQLDGPCCFVQDKIQRELDPGFMRSCDKCCMDCVWLNNCRLVCHLCESAARKQREAEREEARALASAKREKLDLLNRTMWTRFRDARAAAGVPMEEVMEIMDIEEDEAEGFAKIEELKSGEPEDNPYDLWEDDVRVLIGIADRFGCSVDYLLGRTEVEDQPKVWQTGKPPRDGRYYARFEDEAGTMTFPADYRADSGDWSVAGGGMKITAECTGWWWLPED